MVDTAGKLAVIDAFNVEDERIISSISDLAEIRQKFEKFVTDKLQGDLKDLDLHLGLILVAFAIKTTSRQAVKGDAEFVNYTLSGHVSTATEKDITEFLNSLPQLKDRKNKARVFCRSFAKEYIKICRSHANSLPKQTRAIKLGIPDRYHYLQADFVTDCSELTDEEQAVLLHGRNHAVAPINSATTPIVTNLYELGGGKRN
uniref:Major coat protein n=1 Tax=Mint virus 1 TaxID=300740 RepID=Q52V33_9CLOS|nr:major coat protein [Mint virus 1]AAX98730.1 major coat protein [Mint virus 1]